MSVTLLPESFRRAESTRWGKLWTALGTSIVTPAADFHARSFFVAQEATARLSIERGWAALVVKPHGLRPGILMRDAKDDVYLLRFDPIGRLEMATGAAMVSSRFFHALGYHVPESHVVYFERRQLVASETGDGVSSAGARRELTEEDIDIFLANVERDPRRGYRAVAIPVSRDFEGLLGPYQVYGVRSKETRRPIREGTLSSRTLRASAS